MRQVDIVYCPSKSRRPELPHGEANALYQLSPYFEVREDSLLILSTQVTLTEVAARLILEHLEGLNGTPQSLADVDQILIGYGASTTEAAANGLESVHDGDLIRWDIGRADVEQFLRLVVKRADKQCSYLAKLGRDWACVAAAPEDPTATLKLSVGRAAPTSRTICDGCNLPSDQVLCSNLMHPNVVGITGSQRNTVREVRRAICNGGRLEVQDVSKCRAGGHSCWQRRVFLAAPAFIQVSPLELPEQFDVLDAYWRLLFGKKYRLVNLTTTTAPASLSLACSSRAEFESRLSALADIIDKLSVHESLLDFMDLGAQENLHGSLDKLEAVLNERLHPEQRPSVLTALTSLRRIRQARNIIQHGVTSEGGFTAKMRTIGIHDAPPNWSAAWDSVRIKAANALNVLRDELRKAIDDGA